MTEEKKIYLFADEGYWYSNGCDCCEDVYMYNYNLVGRYTHNFGSAHSYEDCLLQALAVHDGYEYYEDVPEEWYDLSGEQLEAMMEERNIEVEVI